LKKTEPTPLYTDDDQNNEQINNIISINKGNTNEKPKREATENDKIYEKNDKSIEINESQEKSLQNSLQDSKKKKIQALMKGEAVLSEENENKNIQTRTIIEELNKDIETFLVDTPSWDVKNL